MVSTVSLVSLIALCISSAAALEWKSLKINIPNFHKIPLTVTELLATNNYSMMVRDDDLNMDFYAFKNDPRVAIGVDSYGNIGGARVSLIKSDLPSKAIQNNKTFLYDHSKIPLWKSGSFFNTPVWYLDILFVSEEKLKAGGRKETGGLVGEDVFMKLSGQWITLPKKECDAPAKKFVKQSCAVKMGLHYVYQVSSKSACETLQPVFGLYDNNELVAFGITTFGIQKPSKERVWFENVPKDMFMAIFSNKPDCMEPWYDSYGYTAIHFYIKDDPNTIPCSKSTCQ